MFNFAIIGCGVIAPSHVKAIKESAPRAKLYAVCDIIEDKARKFMSEHGAEKYYTDYKKMLLDKKIDIVCICTPSGMHGQMAIDTARAGKHIVCEKPMEITAAKLTKVINELNKHDVKMACVFQRRVQPVSIKVKKAIEEGLFGKVLIADAYLKSYRSREYYLSADWRATWEWDGGGALMNQGVHGVDLISWFMGGVESVSAVVRTQFHNIDVEDTALALVKYRNGAVGVIEGTTCVNPAQDAMFEIHCEKGSIIFNADGGITQWGTEKFAEPVSADGVKDDPAALNSLSHTPIFTDLMDAIEQGREPMVAPSEGRKAVDTILAIYKSSKLKKEIVL